MPLHVSSHSIFFFFRSGSFKNWSNNGCVTGGVSNCWWQSSHFFCVHTVRSRLALDLRSVCELNDAVDEGITTSILQHSFYPQQYYNTTSNTRIGLLLYDETASYRNDNDTLLSTWRQEFRSSRGATVSSLGEDGSQLFQPQTFE